MNDGVQAQPQDTSSIRCDWYSKSTWIALAIVLVYVLFTFGFPLIPIVILAGSMEDLVLYSVPVLGLAIWITAMVVRVFVHKKRRQLIWTGLRYAVIAFGGAGLIVMLAGMQTPGYIRKTEQFHKQMQQQADIPAIRTWAEAFKMTPEDKPTLGGDDVFVSDKQWPDCIRRLSPAMVQYSPAGKCVHIVFGGGFGHWGLSVGPKGTPANMGGYVLPLEDGAWVWHEIQ